MTTALVLGKFYPPHAGHVHLLKTALATHDHVVVLCLGATFDTHRPERRLRALLEDARAAGLDTARIIGRAGFDHTPFDLTNPAVWSAHLHVFRGFLAGCPALDTVVSSEAYGPELADRLGVPHVACDPGRSTVPTSGTEIRADPIRAWSTLGPGTRRMLTTRIVVLGAESTGTTAVSAGLAARLRARGDAWAQTRLVEEFGRTVTERKQRMATTGVGPLPLSVEWTSADFSEIATTQAWLEEEGAALGGPALVCDTDAFATPVWERRYLGPSARLQPSELGCGDVYLVTHHEGVPFVQDGMRDGEHLRSAMTEEFVRQLIAHQRPFSVLTGTLEQRIRLAERITDQTVARRLAFADPI